MRSFALFALLAYAILGFMQLVSAIPIAPTKDLILKRDNADLTSVLTKLESSVSRYIREINNLIETKTATKDNIEHRIKEITAALTTARSELTVLKPSSANGPQADATPRQITTALTVHFLVR